MKLISVKMSDAEDVETDEDAVGESSLNDNRVDPAVAAQAEADAILEDRDYYSVPQAKGQPLTNCVYCDKTGCFTVQCPNMPICQTTLPLCVAQCQGNKCMHCAAMGLAFEFVEPVEDCCICYEQEGIQVHLPCGHHVCAACFGKPLLEPSSTNAPEPQEYGCPEAGADATDEEVEAMEDAWREREPQQQAAYTDAWERWDDEQMERRMSLSQVLAKCPLCRASTTWDRQA